MVNVHELQHRRDGVDRLHRRHWTIDRRARPHRRRDFGFGQPDVLADGTRCARRATASGFGDHVAEDVVNKVRRGCGRGLRADGELLLRVILVVVNQRADRGLAEPVAAVVDVGLVAAQAVVGQQVAGVIVGERADGRRPARDRRDANVGRGVAVHFLYRRSARLGWIIGQRLTKS